MRAKNQDRNTARILTATLLLLALAVCAYADFPVPTGPDYMTNTSTQSPLPTGGYDLTTGGGTITWLNINATTQNPRWKAYVGNISGQLALQDASKNTVYNWNISSMEGEIYSTRKTTLVDWDSISCANLAQIQAEETALNMTSSSEDSIISTFSKKSHAQFYAGLTLIEADSCNSTNLYVNSQESSDFAELLLHDGSYIVYTALIEDAITGFDGNQYDFQMILPDSGLEGSQTPETYYFYVELI
ncbi:hypothetical protein JW898_05440 [Candidatus Woesearchaeota archaeon]|nr:hypothetical protein [Candidatus Woesearchaeota archaeon]